MSSRKFDKLYVCEALWNRMHNGGFHIHKINMITLFLLKLHNSQNKSAQKLLSSVEEEIFQNVENIVKANKDFRCCTVDA